jgi:hypothetical protein
VCDLQVGVTGSFTQNCPTGNNGWVSLAFPVETNGALVSAVNMTHNTNTAGGHLYLLGDCGGNPDINNRLYTGCSQIVAGSVGPQVYPIDPPVATGSTTWVVAVFQSTFSFDVAYNSSLPGAGLAYGNLSSSGVCGNWQDLNVFGFGFCYCVSVETSGGTEDCCEGALCDGDANGDGVVDPLDSGYAAARFGADVMLPGNCQADVNCDGIIDPLDGGYILARFGTCNAPILCAPGGGECGGGGGLENDACADAITVTEGTTPFNNSDATTDGPADCDEFTGNFDIWYEYTAPAAGTVVVSTCGLTFFDSTLSVYNGFGCPVGAPLACNDDNCGEGGGPSELSVTVTNGQNLKIRVGGWDDASGNASPKGSGELTIYFVPSGQGACCFADESCTETTSSGCTGAGGTFTGVGTACTPSQCQIPSVNDSCTDVTPVPVANGETVTFTGDNSDAAVDDCTTFSGNEVWEAFSISETLNVVIDYCETVPTFSPVWGYVSDSCPCGGIVQADSTLFLPCPGGETDPIMTYNNLPAGEYWIPVYAAEDATLGPYTIHVTASLPPADCCVVHPQPGCDEIDGVPAPGVEECVCAVDAFCCDTTWDEACVSEVEGLGCADCPSTEPLVNDECDGAVALACDTSITVTGGDYTTNAGDPVSTCEIANGGPFLKDTSWWYTVTVPTGTTSFTIDLCDSSGDDDNDTVVSVFTRTSSCGALSQLACDDDTCVPPPAFGPSQVTVNSPVANDDYIVLVDVYSASDPDATYVATLTCTP